MKRTNYYIFGLLLVITAWLSACQNDNDNVFGENPAERNVQFINDVRTALCSAENGWLMQYFITPEKQGINFYVKFNDTDSVIIGANDNKSYRENGSRYGIALENGPLLVFTTFNELLHKYADPDSNYGSSEGGDFEFVIVDLKQDLIQLKGKRSGSIVWLNRLKNANPKEYLNQSDEMKSFIFASETSLLLQVENKSYSCSNGSSGIFSLKEEGGTDMVMPYITLPDGLRFYQPFIADQKKVQTFRINADQTELICVDEGVNAKITGPNSRDFFFDRISLSKSMAFTAEKESMSAPVKVAYDKVKAGIEGIGRTLNIAAFTYQKANGYSFLLRTSRGTSIAAGMFGFTMEKFADNEINLAFKGFKGEFDNGTNLDENGNNQNSRKYYDEYDGVPDFIEIINGNYTVTPIGNPLQPATVKFTNTSQPDIGFYLTIK